MPKRRKILKFPENLRITRITAIYDIVNNYDDPIEQYNNDNYQSCPNDRLNYIGAITLNKIGSDYELVDSCGIDEINWWYIISGTNTYIEFNTGYHIFIRKTHYESDMKLLFDYIKNGVGEIQPDAEDIMELIF